jgi:ketosteroid isomerase-like protein
MKELKSAPHGFRDASDQVERETAWATFEYNISGMSEKGAFKGSGLVTAILEKRGGQWRIVHWHSSAKPRKK